MNFFDLKAAVAALEADARVHDNTTVQLEIRCERDPVNGEPICPPETVDGELAAARLDDDPRRIVLSDR